MARKPRAAMFSFSCTSFPGWCLCLLLGTVLWAGAAPEAAAQRRTAGEWAWKPILTHEGVRFEYIFYRTADNTNNGIVVKLTNTNDYPVAYRFKIVFRAEGATHVEAVEGRLDAGEIKTGDAEGLFWVPFKDGRTIGEVGLRGFKIQRVRRGS